jgi:hypothetical protein
MKLNCSSMLFATSARGCRQPNANHQQQQQQQQQQVTLQVVAVRALASRMTHLEATAREQLQQQQQKREVSVAKGSCSSCRALLELGMLQAALTRLLAAAAAAAAGTLLKQTLQ